MIKLKLSFFLFFFLFIEFSLYRKPFTTMWDEMVAKYNGGIVPNAQTSFYCGDAAGRKKGWKTGAGNDFSAGKYISFSYGRYLYRYYNYLL